MAPLLPAAAILVVLGCLAYATCAANTELEFTNQITRRERFPDDAFEIKFTQVTDRGRGGNLRGVTVANNPMLGSLPNGGGAQTLVTINACGVQLPHFHPRGTEFAHILNGELDFSFLEENGRRLVRHRVKKGTTFVSPEGTMHFAKNPSCKEAQFLASFPFSDQGTTFFAAHLFNRLVDVAVLKATVPGLTDKDISRLRSAVTEATNPGVDEECLKRCSMGGWATKYDGFDSSETAEKEAFGGLRRFQNPGADFP